MSLPTGVEPGMMLVLAIETEAGQPPAIVGWTQAPDSPVNNANGTRLTVYWRRATGSGDEPTVVDSGDHQSARVIVFNGVVATGDPWEVTNSATGDTTAISIPGDTTVGADRLVVAFVSHGLDKLTEHFATWANADLTNVTEQFDNSTDVSGGGGIACATGERAVAGAFGATTAVGAADAPWAGWVGALIYGAPIGSGPVTPPAVDTPATPPTELAGFGTYQYDTPEDLLADRDPINGYLVWQYMDQGAEDRNKKIDAVRITAKGKDVNVQIHAASPGDEIDRDDIEDGVNARISVDFADSTEVTRYERKKIKSKNLSIWTVRYSTIWDGTGIRDRLDELIISGDVHGTKK